MKKIYFLLLLIATSFSTANAQTFEWGTATWNIPDGKVFENIDEFNVDGVVLTYPNPANYTLTFLNAIGVSYDLYVDDATEPLKETASAQSSAAVSFGYPFVEGHKYKIVTTGAALVFANLATYKTDTLSLNSDSYTLSFEIKGPELVKTIDVDAKMSLAITNQEAEKTVSLIDVNEVLSALGVGSIAEANIYGLKLNGAYVTYEWYGPDYFDGWRDADGEYTSYNGGWNRLDGHNAYPAVYCIKINQACDSITYFFYDYWKEYDPNAGTEIGGGGVITPVKHRAPETSYNSVIWDWVDEGDGTTYQYTRMYRCNEGQDYKASFAIVANKKMVKINATLHFVSQEDYLTGVAALKHSDDEVVTTEYYSVGGARLSSPQRGINIVKSRLADGRTVTRKVLVR